MQAKREIILVTGPPRSGTTPVGDVLTRAPRTVSLYEPWGPTGDRRVTNEFPIVDHDGGFDLDHWRFDLARLRLSLGPQARPSHGSEPLARRLLLKLSGSRTLHSYRLARMQPLARRIIWKDPHAIFSLPALLATGLRTVVTLRPPHAMAASYQRLGWETDLPPIYARYAAAYGGDRILDRHIDGPTTPAHSAACVWRMAVLLVVRHLDDPNLFIVRSTALEADETALYRALLDWLNLPSARPLAHLAKRQGQNPRRTAAHSATHHFTRPIAQTNSYWRDILSDDDIAVVTEITGDLQDILTPATGAPA